MRRNVVLVGGGHANTQVVRMLKAQVPEDTVVTLVSEMAWSYYSGMLPGWVAGLYEPKQLQIDLKALCEDSNCQLLTQRVVEIDHRQKRVRLADGSSIPYDIVALNIGSRTRGDDVVPGVKEYAITTRPINALLAKLETAEKSFCLHTACPRVVVVGGGVAGIELAFTMYERYKNRYGTVQVIIVHQGTEILASGSRWSRRLVHRALSERHINLVTNVSVVSVSKTDAMLSSSETISFDILLWATGASPQHLELNGLQTDPEGFLLVNSYLQSVSDPSVFAAGDCIQIEGHPVGFPPKAGVYAVREGPIIAKNIIAQLTASSLTRYEPQSDFLSLMNLGDHRAIGAKFGLAFSGHWVWKLKDHIDRKWMNQFRALPDHAELGQAAISSELSADAAELTPFTAVKTLFTDEPTDEQHYERSLRVLDRMATDDHFRDQVIQSTL
eukprot:GILJ01010563.1.p1 GENE.GILJ01010563.1~~GILJ01010563.1.p1  ORF type:complete len:442 (+),score=56.59 GILJ01010563.1:67-1392(+)